MEDRKNEENEVDTSTINDESEKKEVTTTKSKKTSKITTYVISGVVILVIILGTIFLLEKQGRINTGLFTEIIADMKAKAPVAKVNGVVISNKDLDSLVRQFTEMAKLQGADYTSEESINSFKSEALETLINGEILRQDADNNGFSVTDEEIDERFNAIVDGVGGREELDKRMSQFGIDETNLKQDIKDELNIQNLLDAKIKKEEIEVTDEEISSLYKEANTGGNLPAMEEIRESIIKEIRESKYQLQIADYLQKLKDESKIEKLI